MQSEGEPTPARADITIVTMEQTMAQNATDIDMAPPVKKPGSIVASAGTGARAGKCSRTTQRAALAIALVVVTAVATLGALLAVESKRLYATRVHSVEKIAIHENIDSESPSAGGAAGGATTVTMTLSRLEFAYTAALHTRVCDCNVQVKSVTGEAHVPMRLNGQACALISSTNAAVEATWSMGHDDISSIAAALSDSASGSAGVTCSVSVQLPGAGVSVYSTSLAMEWPVDGVVQTLAAAAEQTVPAGIHLGGNTGTPTERRMQSGSEDVPAAIAGAEHAMLLPSEFGGISIGGWHVDLLGLSGVVAAAAGSTAHADLADCGALGATNSGLSTIYQMSVSRITTVAVERDGRTDFALTLSTTSNFDSEAAQALVYQSALPSVIGEQVAEAAIPDTVKRMLDAIGVDATEVSRAVWQSFSNAGTNGDAAGSAHATALVRLGPSHINVQRTAAMAMLNHMLPQSRLCGSEVLWPVEVAIRPPVQQGRSLQAEQPTSATPAYSIALTFQTAIVTLQGLDTLRVSFRVSSTDSSFVARYLFATVFRGLTQHVQYSLTVETHLDPRWGRAVWEYGAYSLTSHLPRASSLWRETSCGSVRVDVEPIYATMGSAVQVDAYATLAQLGACVSHVADEYLLGKYADAASSMPWVMRESAICDANAQPGPMPGANITIRVASPTGSLLAVHAPGLLQRRSWVAGQQFWMNRAYQWVASIDPGILTPPTYGSFRDVNLWFPPAAELTADAVCVENVYTAATAFRAQVQRLTTDYIYCYQRGEPLACAQLQEDREAIGYAGGQGLLLASASSGNGPQAVASVVAYQNGAPRTLARVDLMTYSNSGPHWGREQQKGGPLQAQAFFSATPVISTAGIWGPVGVNATAVLDYLQWDFAPLMMSPISGVPCACGFQHGGFSLIYDNACFMGFLRGVLAKENPQLWFQRVTTGAWWGGVYAPITTVWSWVVGWAAELDKRRVFSREVNFVSALNSIPAAGVEAWNAITRRMEVSVAVPAADLQLCGATIGSLTPRIFIDPSGIQGATFTTAPPPGRAPSPALLDFACALAVTQQTGRAANITSTFSATIWQMPQRSTAECNSVTLPGTINLGSALADIDAVVVWTRQLITGAGGQPLTALILALLPQVNVANDCAVGRPHDPRRWCSLAPAPADEDVRAPLPSPTPSPTNPTVATDSQSTHDSHNTPAATIAAAVVGSVFGAALGVLGMAAISRRGARSPLPRHTALADAGNVDMTVVVSPLTAVSVNHVDAATGHEDAGPSNVSQ